MNHPAPHTTANPTPQPGIPDHAHRAAADLVAAGFSAVTYQPTNIPPTGGAPAGEHPTDTAAAILIGWAISRTEHLIPASITVLVTTTHPQAATLAALDEARDEFGTRRHSAYDTHGQWFVANTALTHLTPAHTPPAWTATTHTPHTPTPANPTLIAKALLAAAAQAYRHHAGVVGPGPRARAHAAESLHRDISGALHLLAGHITLEERTENTAISLALDWATAADTHPDSDATTPAAAHPDTHPQPAALEVPDTLDWGAPTTPLEELVRRFDHGPQGTHAPLTNLRPTSSVRAGHAVILPSEIQPHTGRIIDQRDTYAGPAYLVADTPDDTTDTPAPHSPHLREGDLLICGGAQPVAHLITAADQGRKFSRHFLALRGNNLLIARVLAFVLSAHGSRSIAAATGREALGSLRQQAGLLRSITIPATSKHLAVDDDIARAQSPHDTPGEK